MSDLVTLAQAKAHLRIEPSAGGSVGSPPDESDTDLVLKIAQASEIVRRLCVKVDDDDYALEVASWVSDPDPISGETTVPTVVQGMVLYALAVLWRFRGDDTANTQPADPWKEVRQILEMTGYRDPGALA